MVLTSASEVCAVRGATGSYRSLVPGLGPHRKTCPLCRRFSLRTRAHTSGRHYTALDRCVPSFGLSKGAKVLGQQAAVGRAQKWVAYPAYRWTKNTS